jgi:hypothetical protein
MEQQIIEGIEIDSCSSPVRESIPIASEPPAIKKKTSQPVVLTPEQRESITRAHEKYVEGINQQNLNCEQTVIIGQNTKELMLDTFREKNYVLTVVAPMPVGVGKKPSSNSQFFGSVFFVFGVWVGFCYLSEFVLHSSNKDESFENNFFEFYN